MFRYCLEKGCSKTGLAAKLIGLAILLVTAGIGEAWALNQSQNVALVPDAMGRYYYGGILPTSGFPDGYAPTFTNVDPLAIGVTENLSSYDTVVLVGICDIGSTSFLGNAVWKSAIEAFVYNGGKLIIWDSECQNTDYSKFLLPFTTNNPGQLGATGTLGITEENSLSRTSPLSPRYVDVSSIGSQTDAVGDANVFISQDPLWCVDMRAINASIGAPARPTHTYAGTQTLKLNGLGDGLIIYDGLDKDFIGYTANTGTENLIRVWLFELLQPFNPDGLPCGVASTCGNGFIDAGEACDPAVQPTGCPSGQNCEVNNCVCVTPPWCGDGVISSPEQCDPARVPTGCSSALPVCNNVSCQCELPTCGNNQIEANEVCDGTSDAACPGACLPPGNVNECKCPVCGDDSVNRANEECDGIDQKNCTAGCNPPGGPRECLCVNVCGNGHIDSGEQCDDGSANGTSASCCTSLCTLLANGTTCSDGNACTQNDACQAGACIGGSPVTCTALDQCHDVGACDPATGACSNPQKPNGTTCNDGNACTKTDTCQAGACVGGSPVTCTALDQCHDVGACDPATGACSNPAKPNGTACNDGSACTQTDICQAGACVGGNPVACAALDQCHDAGVCDASTGLCSNPAKPNGTACNDGNACTQTDTCQAGTCGGSNPIACIPLDACHLAGTCDTTTGQCSNPTAPDGTSCGTNATCAAGICVTVTNRPPDCNKATADQSELWPPDHGFEPVTISGVSDPNGDQVKITITSIRQDEKVDGCGDGDDCPDGKGIGTSTAYLRSERSGQGDGRVYHISFTADDGHGGICTGEVKVCVPHDRGSDSGGGCNGWKQQLSALSRTCVDQGPLYDSTGPCKGHK